MSHKHKVTISDIAAKSGVSRTTVSLVLRDQPGIGTDTRDRVMTAALELGYARKAPQKRRNATIPDTVAVLFRARTRVEHDRSLGVNPFYSWILTGMEAAAHARNVNLVFGTLAVNDNNDILQIPNHLLEQQLSGLIIIGAFPEQTILELVRPASCAHVLVDGPSTIRTHDVVASDNVGGGRAMTEYLISQGHTRIACICPKPGSNPNFSERELGYTQAMEAAGLPVIIGRLTGELVADALNNVLSQDAEVTAVFVVNDAFAVGVLKAALEMGISVPEQLSIAGFDDTDHAVSSVPELTTMRVDKIGMGRHAILQLFHRIEWPNSAPVARILTPQLVERKSVRVLAHSTKEHR